MTDKRCFIQFPHPGAEQGPGRDGYIEWFPNTYPHKRKFMQLNGSWIDKKGKLRHGDLWAWGEWEPQSRLIRDFDVNAQLNNPHAPQRLWSPFLRHVRNDRDATLHNTDPYIFGDSFIYSNCRQLSKAGKGLKHLARGSVIAFGSGKNLQGERSWVLDTVFVVEKHVDYLPSDLKNATKCRELGLSTTFKAVTGDVVSGIDDYLRLYFGATPSNCVDGMFSFFPALPASENLRFSRPAISNLENEYLNPRNWQWLKGQSTGRSRDQIKELWKKLKKEVLCAGLVLGVFAEEPRRID